jgi:TRAP-type C4-dicarboxylate transport system permease small subunit
MKQLSSAVKLLSRVMYWISCGALVSIVALTVIDVTLRKLGSPIDFTFEVVVFLAAIVIGFALPQTSMDKGHVVMEFLTVKLPGKWRRAFAVTTRCIGIATFIIIGWNVIRIGNHFLEAKQASPVLEIPEFPVAYAVGICCFIECLVLVLDLKQTSEGAEL